MSFNSRFDTKNLCYDLDFVVKRCIDCSGKFSISQSDYSSLYHLKLNLDVFFKLFNDLSNMNFRADVRKPSVLELKNPLTDCPHYIEFVK